MGCNPYCNTICNPEKPVFQRLFGLVLQCYILFLLNTCNKGRTGVIRHSAYTHGEL
nr:MAG TPA: hypothetical protein [Caudoviricetes sp.]